MKNDNRAYWIWLAEVFGQGSMLAANLINKFSSAEDVFNGAADELEPGDGFTEENVKTIRNKLRNNSLKRAYEILELCAKERIDVITFDSECYPAQLKTLRDMPLVLYVKGRMPDVTNNCLVTVVGTRKMTDYGRKISYSMGLGLACGGAVVVSGMALGSDSMALIGALEAGGSTIAVLGSGVDIIYPKEHKEIYYKILDRGAVISEYPPKCPPIGSHFPIRNRIMSGLSDATLVVEANESSGSMITANCAINQGKRIFAVPGKVGDEGSEGPNLLIREGAIPAVCPEDILSEFEFLYKHTVNVQATHSKMRGLDLETMSSVAMERSRIVSSANGRNYYGKGTYGGRLTEHDREIIEKRRLAESMKSKAEKNDAPAAKPKDKKENNYNKTGKQTVNNAENVIPAQKIELEMLDENEIKVYNNMKPNVPTIPDSLVADDMPVSQVLSALTMLEIAGAVESGGGGYYMRISPDNIMLSEND